MMKEALKEEKESALFARIENWRDCHNLANNYGEQPVTNLQNYILDKCKQRPKRSYSYTLEEITEGIFKMEETGRLRGTLKYTKRTDDKGCDQIVKLQIIPY